MDDADMIGDIDVAIRRPNDMEFFFLLVSRISSLVSCLFRFFNHNFQFTFPFPVPCFLSWVSRFTIYTSRVLHV